VLGAAIAGVLLAVYPVAAGRLVARMFTARLSERLGRPVTVGSGRGGLGRVVLHQFAVGDAAAGGAGRAPLVTADEVSIPFGVALGGRGPITISGLRVDAVRGGPDDNVTDIIDRLKARRASAAASAGTAPDAPAPTASVASGLPGVAIEKGRVAVHDAESGLSLSIGSIDGTLMPGEQLSFQLRSVAGVLAVGGGDRGPRFGAAELDIRLPLAPGLHPAGYPTVRVDEGFATPLPSLSLTGINGTVAPPPAGVAAAEPPVPGVVIDLHGSYGGARESLWTAKGNAHPAGRQGRLSLRAAQFSLDRIADVLPRSVLTPGRATVDAALDLTWAGDAVRFAGDLAVAGLSLQHDAVSADPVEGLSLGLVLRGAAYPAQRRVELDALEGRIRDLVARISGSVELPKGTFAFPDGSRLRVVPKVDLDLTVPRIACARLLGSIPAALAPKLQGFALGGTFEAEVGTKVDFADLDALDLHGKIGINGCKVLKAPPAVALLAEPVPIVQTVEVPLPAGEAGGGTESMQFVVGPDNPDFVAYEDISPHLVNSIMTTEDNGFFKHHGWVSSQFKTALRANLAGGGFRVGASSITMQMVKNVLLSQEKTLSRKLQELFLVWYLEQVLPKERILELYFNAIEFGPRIYGIGAAARHYFGKSASDLTPLESAFFSSILPSPKRRYIQYCHGSLLPAWDRYVRRIVAKVHERGRLTDDEFNQAMAQPLVFDRSEATFTEKQCVDWVKRMTARPEPETPPELEGGDAEAGEGDARPAMASRGGHRGAGPHHAVRAVSTGVAPGKGAAAGLPAVR
jgi:hypothetical protein